MSNFGIAESDSLMRKGFAPWIQELGIKFEQVDADVVRVRVPNSPRLHRAGDMVCGQAMMAVADTIMVFAIAAQLDVFRNMTTVNQTTSFLRPATDGDMMAEARVIKSGRQLVYGDVNIYTTTPDKPVAHVTVTCMLI